MNDFRYHGTPEERFWAKVDKGEGCWEWQAALSHGYGAFGITATHVVRAHRFSWELAHGPVPDGLFICHHCDNRRCVRPDHLFLGTNAANMADAKAKGRMASGPEWQAAARIRAPRGEGHWNVKLTDRQVAEIRSRTDASGVALAREYGVSGATISMIRTGKRRGR